MISKDGRTKYSISAMSGAPLPAFSASWILVYSTFVAPSFSSVTQMSG